MIDLATSALGEAHPGKVVLYEGLVRVVRLFEQGLAAFAAGRVPGEAAWAELAAAASGVVPCLGARLRRMSARFSPAPTLPQGSTGGKAYGQMYMIREEHFARCCVLLLDQALGRAMDVQRDLLADREWELAKGVVDWTCLLHFQLGAFPAVEIAFAVRSAGIPSLARRVLAEFSATKRRGMLSSAVREMIACELDRLARDAAGPGKMAPGAGLSRREHIRLAKPYQMTSLAVGLGERMIAGGFAADQKTGGVFLVDCKTGASECIFEGVVVTGVCYDADNTQIAVTGLRSRLIQAPHILFIGLDGRVIDVVAFDDFPVEDGIRTPGFIKTLGNSFFFRDAASKRIIEIDKDSKKIKKIHYSVLFNYSTRFSVCNSRVVINTPHQGCHTYDVERGQTHPMRCGNLQGAYAQVSDDVTGDIYSLGVLFAFSAAPSVRSRASVLTRTDADGRLVWQHHVITGVCSDLAFLRTGNGLHLYLATERGILTFAEESGA